MSIKELQIALEQMIGSTEVVAVLESASTVTAEELRAEFVRNERRYRGCPHCANLSSATPCLAEGMQSLQTKS